ncbi:MAG TPA: hypothetical protein VKB01_08725 [Thermomicrobiales bacterium]|jgi:hypothetical protein|nr:hypothetical protein [Thermomicrobiales bacterium]
MRHVTADRPTASIFAAVVGAALVGATLLSAAAVNVAQAQNEPLVAANGVLLPSPYDDPAAARIADVAESAVVSATETAPAPPADESTPSGTPEAAVGAPEAGNSTTTILGGSDVAVSSVGGSHEVDGPRRRSERKN